jgi:hypothetical protein
VAVVFGENQRFGNFLAAGKDLAEQTIPKRLCDKANLIFGYYRTIEILRLVLNIFLRLLPSLGARAPGLGLAACQKGIAVGFTTAAAMVNELHEARDEKRLLRLQRQLAGYKLLVVDELGYVPLSPTGAELLFEVFSQRYERGSIIVTSNLPFDEWTGVFASERLTGALLDRLTHHVHILELNGDSFRLKHSKRRISDDQPPTEPG